MGDDLEGFGKGESEQKAKGRHSRGCKKESGKARSSDNCLTDDGSGGQSRDSGGSEDTNPLI